MTMSNALILSVNTDEQTGKVERMENPVKRRAETLLKKSNSHEREVYFGNLEKTAEAMYVP